MLLMSYCELVQNRYKNIEVLFFLILGILLFVNMIDILINCTVTLYGDVNTEMCDGFRVKVK